MLRDKFLSCLKRVSILTLFFFAFPINAQVVSQQEFQNKFDLGISLIEVDPNKSVEIFSNLYAETKSTRVKLEWARSLYAAKRFDESKVIFSEILSEELPLPVRDRVELFLTDINVSIQPFSISFGIVRDSNPKASPKEQQISLFGQIFDYVPEVRPKTESGLLTTLAYTSPQSVNGVIGFSAQLDNYDYPNDLNDRQIAKLILLRRLDNHKNLGVGVSYEQNYLGSKKLYDSPSLLIDYYFELNSSSVLGLGYKKSKLNYSTYDFLNANLDSFSLVYTLDLTPYLKTFIESTYDKSKSESDIYSFNGRMYSLGFKWGTNRGGLQVTGKVSSGVRTFGIDPFFGEVREDRRFVKTISLTKRDLYLFGFRPSLEFLMDKNKSSIPINAYDKKLASLIFTKVF